MSFADQITRHPIPHDAGRGQQARALFPDAPQPLADLIAGAAGCSPFLAGLLEREADWLPSGLRAQDVVAEVTAGFDGLSADDLGPALRQAKRRVALVTALADLGGVWPLAQVTGTLTRLAERATDLAIRAHLATEIRRGKLPETAADAGGIFALAMGKMGAGELNYSSDIDLIVLYDDTAYAPDDQYDARAALIRVTRRMAATLSDITDQGYVFRTDLRLRPDPAVTPVCISTAAALAYYEAEGRTWERAAYIKARPCAGNIAAGERFLSELRPFIWRRHLDFATIQDTRDMRSRIRDHKGLGGRIEIPGHNVKLGRGGIRDIEFFTQTRQLIAGGRDPDLRDSTTTGGLRQLVAKGWVTQAEADELTDHYRELRDVEHRIQMVNDAQTQDLPQSADGLDNIARMMGAPDTALWADALKHRLERVELLCTDFFDPGEAAERPDLPPEAAAITNAWPGYAALRSERAQQIFRRIEPDLLQRMMRAAHPIEALGRFDGFLRSLPAGVQIFSLFQANPHLIDLIVDICATAPGLAQYLSDHSAVLEGVLAGSFFSAWPGVATLREQMDQALAVAQEPPNGSYERALDTARRVTHEAQFRVGVHHLRGLVDAAEAGGQYADIADTAVGALFPVVVQDFARRYGPPPGRGAVVLGMGSLGARRLNAASDLDLIVIYDAAGVEMTEGKRPLAPRAYYAKLTQAMITALSAPTAEGRLFEVDMRLRPSGRQGPVATSIASFRDYQMTEAWTWEHLALTRARVIGFAGNDGAALADDVETLRRQVLAARGTDPRVLPDLAEMRARIFAAKQPDGAWEAKIGRGRLQDIELLVQSFALRAADPARGPEAQLRAGVRAGLIDRTDADKLASALRFLWRMQAGGRLLTDKPLDMQAIGRGGTEFLLRETDQPDLDALASRQAALIVDAGDIIDRLMPQVYIRPSVDQTALPERPGDAAAWPS